MICLYSLNKKPRKSKGIRSLSCKALACVFNNTCMLINVETFGTTRLLVFQLKPYAVVAGVLSASQHACFAALAPQRGSRFVFPLSLHQHTDVKKRGDDFRGFSIICSD